MPVLDPARLVRCGAQSGLPVSFIFRIVTVKEDHLALALEGEDMRRDPVEEPPVVADDHVAAREVIEPLFKRPHGVHVDVLTRHKIDGLMHTMQKHYNNTGAHFKQAKKPYLRDSC
jgi:hypothetical protein